MRVLPRARLRRVPRGDARLRALAAARHGLLVAIDGGLPPPLPRRGRGGERRPARRPRHAAPGRDGLRAPAAHRARAGHHGAPDGRGDGERRVRARHRPDLRTGLLCRHRGDRRGGAARRARGLLREPYPRGGRDAPGRGGRGHPRRARGERARAGEPYQGGGPAQLGQGGKRTQPDRHRARRRRSGRDGRRLSLHRVEHHAAHAPARLGARGRDRGDARAPRGRRRHATASART